MQQQAAAAASMRSVLFERSSTMEDGKLEVEMEAGKIGSRCADACEVGCHACEQQGVEVASVQCAGTSRLVRV